MKVPLSKSIQVDFCPINQSFEKQINDAGSVRNKEYAEELKIWRSNFSGDIGLYSYYRKYAWRSAPNVIPHYIQKDKQWYATLPLQGISTYAEPGDWFTYDINHFALGDIAWNPNVNVDSLIDKAQVLSLSNTFKAIIKSPDGKILWQGNVTPTTAINEGGNHVAFTIRNLKPVLWTPNNPYLYEIILQQFTKYTMDWKSIGLNSH